MVLDFEWDPAKSELNKKKHGISFDEALEIWNGVDMTVKEIAKSQDGESRSATIGFVGDKLYTAIWTERGQKKRLISVRRSREGEKEIFYQFTIQNG